mgnify:FL=1
MKIIYAKKSSGIDEQGSFQNPEYYLKPEPNAQLVVIYGEYPHIKADYEELGINVEVRELPKSKPLTVDLKVGITPELQDVIDQTKAECEKVVAENVELKDQLATSKDEFIAFQNDVNAMKKRIAELEPVVDKKPTAAELKAAKAAEATEQTKE